MLKVAVDATPLIGARTGIGVAAAGMIRSLAGQADLELIGYGLTLSGWRRLRGALPPGVLVARRGPMPAGPLLRVWQHVDRPFIETWTGPVDVVHGTNFVVPPARSAGRVVSVFDLTAVRHPELCTPISRRYPALIARAVADGAWVHTSAHAIATEIVDHFGIQADRVRVVPVGVDPLVVSEPARFERPYILGLGTTEPRKDFPGLVAAFGLVAADHPDLDLRIAGPRGWAEEDLTRAIGDSPYQDRIHRMGWVDEVGPLMAGAQVFAYPSIYEGFGIPTLEAMSVDVPVVATATGAVPEVVGDAAVLVPPGDSEALAVGLAGALTDSELRSRLITAGRRRVAAFTWLTVARSMIDLYRDVAAA